MSDLTAGRALDRTIAARVMGWQWFPYLMDPSDSVDGPPVCPPGVRVHVGTIEEPPKYSTRIEDAWLVVEVMRERGWTFEFDNIAGESTATFWQSRGGSGRWGRVYSTTDASPLAICKAALSAVSVAEHQDV